MSGPGILFSLLGAVDNLQCDVASHLMRVGAGMQLILTGAGGTKVPYTILA
jgi:hypothetical protein